MPIHQNPANTRLANDLKFYRRKIKNDPTAKQHVKEQINRKDPVRFPPGMTDKQATDLTGYRVFAAFQDGTTQPVRPDRLGGGLNLILPAHLGAALPKPPKVGGGTVLWTMPDGSQAQIQVRADGAIIHTGLPAPKLEEVHHYMHAIFDDILYRTRDLLDAINTKLEGYAAMVEEGVPAPVEAAAYTAAVTAFDDFQAGLQPGGNSDYSGAFNFVGFSPVVTNEGFIVSCRVKLNWKNPYHSSSTIKIP